jgi:CO dehydrogenase/acetyl-CoA synthase beta subunit
VVHTHRGPYIEEEEEEEEEAEEEEEEEEEQAAAAYSVTAKPYVSNPQPALLCYASRGHFCKLHMYNTNIANNLADNDTTYCYFSICNPRTSPY